MSLRAQRGSLQFLPGLMNKSADEGTTCLFPACKEFLYIFCQE